MSKKLYVGNLSYSTSQADLEALFSEKWTVLSTNLISDKYSGRSKGFGFVEIESDEDAAAAIEELNGKEVEGRAIVVNEAKPMKEGGGGGGRGGRGGGGGGGFKRKRY
ncbi:MAG: RNA-binding protein [Planctomycetes bacterium]|nr:RNA-binding protein [Planctomycetota bacterium]